MRRRRCFSSFSLLFFLNLPLPPQKNTHPHTRPQLFAESERQVARGGDEPARQHALLSRLPRVLPLVRRWVGFATRLAALDRGQRAREEAAGGGAPSSPFPSEVIWRELRETFPDSLDDFESMNDFHSSVLVWARSIEGEAAASLSSKGGSRRRSRPLEEVAALVGGGGGEDGGRRALAAASPPSPPPRSSSSSSSSSSSIPTSNLTLSLVSAARAAADAGVRGKVKAALRVRAQVQHGGGESEEEEEEEEEEEDKGATEEGGGREPPMPTLAFPSQPERAPRLARAAWKDGRAMLVIFALSAIAALPERALDEAVATLLLKKLSDLPSPSAASSERESSLLSNE